MLPSLCPFLTLLIELLSACAAVSVHIDESDYKAELLRSEGGATPRSAPPRSPSRSPLRSPAKGGPRSPPPPLSLRPMVSGESALSVGGLSGTPRSAGGATARPALPSKPASRAAELLQRAGSVTSQRGVVPGSARQPKGSAPPTPRPGAGGGGKPPLPPKAPVRRDSRQRERLVAEKLHKMEK